MVARDENDRSYEDGQGRPLNPELTGDVLSPRWSTDDTDEQPAIVVSGNETYIMPTEGAAPEPYASQDGAADDSAGYADADSGAHHTQDATALYAPADEDGDDVDDAGDGERRHDPTYLPLDASYEASAGDEPRETRRGFLGSGWTDAGDDPAPGDKEVRRRTKVLLVAAAAVVLAGAGAGWLLSGTSSDDPCAGDRCAGVGQVSAPPPESPTPEDTDQGQDEPVVSSTPDRSASQTTAPTPADVKTRAERTPTPRATPTRIGEPTARQSGRATPVPDGVEKTGAERQTGTEQKQPTSQPTQSTQPPATQAPAPTPTKSEKGLIDILFPWS
ncbi:hypothetical protein [Nonomuraea lactucae]|uniref:hypothetical protein n=1 Tax=Nonomuraea lactucae TaxID=2249762 RepID=UPI000DE1CC3A|nr:hypothetical protein [Nonomuraea lactucae]